MTPLSRFHSARHQLAKSLFVEPAIKDEAVEELRLALNGLEAHAIKTILSDSDNLRAAIEKDYELSEGALRRDLTIGPVLLGDSKTDCAE